VCRAFHDILNEAVRVFCIYIPLIVAAVGWNCVGERVSLALCVAGFAGGLLLWTLLEYGIHRYAFHRLAPHYQHHEFPNDRRYIFAPLWFSLMSAAILWPLLAVAAGSWSTGALIEAGAVTGYLAYELLHIVIHSERPGGALLRELRKHHFYHHFADDTKCYGVVTPFWDRVFGSMPPAR
jgi:sterol desaturase/sphingolipid hydroxylase (fatty acid hydroxylase superfamily)